MRPPLLRPWAKIVGLTLGFALLMPFPALSVEKNSARIKPKIEEIFSRFLRRQVEIDQARWVVFPITMKATDLKLWEKPGLLIAQAPQASMRISLKTLTSGRLRVDRMTFTDALITLRFTHEWKTNLSDMILDSARFAHENYKPGQKQKVAYNLFQVKNARLDVVDAETGGRPFGDLFIVNGQGDISGLGPQTQFPFHVTAVSASTTSAMNVDVSGTLSSRPNMKIVAHNVPVRAAINYLPVLTWFDGSFDATVHFSKAAIYRFLQINLAGKNIRTRSRLPFPKIQIDGKFHLSAPSTLTVALEGQPTRFDAVLHIKDLISKKVSLSIQSRNADIAECINWCRSGWLMAQGKTELAQPLAWQVTGEGDIDAQFLSTLGPRLLREVDGTLKLNIRNGRLTEMPGFLKALALLNMTNLLKNSTGVGLPFKNIHGVIDIKDGVATARDPILLESAVLDVAFKGRVNFPKNVINAQIRLGQVWVEVTGPIDNPTVFRKK